MSVTVTTSLQHACDFWQLTDVIVWWNSHFFLISKNLDRNLFLEKTVIYLKTTYCRYIMTRSNEDTDSHFSVQMINGLCEHFAAVFTVQLLIQSQLFKDEIFLFYVRIHCLPRSKYCPPRLNKTNPLICRCLFSDPYTTHKHNVSNT
jgi:hypothetical protein